MSRSYEKIRDEALELSDDERAALAEELYNSTLTDEERALEDEWDRRADDLVSGKVKGMPADEAIAEAHAALAADARRASSRR